IHKNKRLPTLLAAKQFMPKTAVNKTLLVISTERIHLRKIRG
ncbi:MAG: hypothetical protein RIR31_1228, partial [Bacteroidota bacterium]